MKLDISYDEWFIAECLPFTHSSPMLTLKHMELYAKDTYAGTRHFFEASCLFNCIFASVDIAVKVVKNPRSFATEKCSALCFLVAVSPWAAFAEEKIEANMVKKVLLENDAEDIFYLERTKLIQALLRTEMSSEIDNLLRLKIQATLRALQMEMVIDEQTTHSELHRICDAIRNKLKHRIEQG